MTLSETIPYGLCHCGCGEKTNIPSKNHKQNGWIKGVPVKFVRGHACSLRQVCPPSPYGTKYISLTQGKFALVDEDDHAKLTEKKWSARWNRCTKTFYAVSGAKDDSGKFRTILMHREILGLKDPKYVPDHINHDTLDNRRSNLRPATYVQNRANASFNSTNQSGYKGVHKDCRSKNIWIAKVGGKVVARCRSAEEAAKAHDAVAKMQYGEFAFLNFP